MSRGVLQNRGFLATLWVAILLLGAYRCFSYIRYDPHKPAPLTEEAVRLGHSLYQHGDFSNPFQTLDTGPSAHTSPGFPVLVAAIYRLTGDGANGRYALQMTEATVVLIQIALLPIVMWSLGTSLFAGLLAGFLAALGVRRAPTWEANYVGLLLMLATLLASRYCSAIQGTGGESRFFRSPWKIALALGTLWGVILLTGPSTGSVWASWVILGGWLSWRKGFRYAWLPILIMPLVLAAPWEWRNYKLFHAIIPLRDSLGLELHISNNPCARVTFWENWDNRNGQKCYAHPNDYPAEAQKVVELGEVAYNQLQMREAVEWTKSNPQRAVSLWIQRFKLFWFPQPGRLVAMWTIDLMTPAMLLGLLFLARANRASATLLMTFVVVYPLVYYLIQAAERYRLPILWVTFGLAATALAAPLEWAFLHVDLCRRLLPSLDEHAFGKKS